MLSYLGFGERRYGDAPNRVYDRRFWEFQAVVQGAIGMTLPQGPSLLRRRCLWLSPPRHLHGWAGEKGCAAEVAVFHFVSIPESLQLALPPGEAVEISLTSGDCRRLRLLMHRALQYWKHPAPGMMICYEHILMELSLMVFERMVHPAHPANKQLAERKVGQALQWYSEKIADNPSLQDVAQVVGTSPSHLRRLFHEVLQTSPKAIFDQLRFQRAMQLMTDSGIKLESVAQACGFESPSTFSRAFKLKFGCSPDMWRNEATGRGTLSVNGGDARRIPDTGPAPGK